MLVQQIHNCVNEGMPCAPPSPPLECQHLSWQRDTSLMESLRLVLPAAIKYMEFMAVLQVPLVVADSVQGFTRTKQAVEFLRRNKAWADVAK